MIRVKLFSVHTLILVSRLNIADNEWAFSSRLTSFSIHTHICPAPPSHVTAPSGISSIGGDQLVNVNLT